MNVFLMHKDHDFNRSQVPVWNADVLLQDLDLSVLLDTMARGNNFMFETVKRVLLHGSDLDEMKYRRDIQKDCIGNPSVVRYIYILAQEALKTRENTFWGVPTETPSYLLSTSVKMLQQLVDILGELKSIADDCFEGFISEGFTRFFSMLREEFSDEYLAAIQEHLEELKFDKGVFFSVELGEGNKGINYILHKTDKKKRSLAERLFSRDNQEYSFSISANDGAPAELKSRAVNIAANVLAQSLDHIYGFFEMLRIELTFYLGCLNLYEELERIGEPVCFPEPVEAGQRLFSCSGLYDVCLALTMREKVVGNDIAADSRDLMIITGANQGGKSTFLRSIGLAQLMMQCGMFVPAESFSANIGNGIFSHFRRGEDVTMESGKLDEELKRMSDIVAHLSANSLVLFDESFMATNEREGSEIARQITGALLEKGIKVCFVTHQYEFSSSYFYNKMINTVFLRAERKDDGTRTFKIIEGEPLQTGYGEDLYKLVFTGGQEFS
ncbi:MAG: hypothetical protein JW712_13535 [Dehalococcoidales bacterium]|nr:hypothetical protein [Dehalococcoidales bacterium]